MQHGCQGHAPFTLKGGDSGRCLHLTQRRRGDKGTQGQLGGGEAARQHDTSENWSWSRWKTRGWFSGGVRLEESTDQVQRTSESAVHLVQERGPVDGDMVAYACSPLRHRAELLRIRPTAPPATGVVQAVTCSEPHGTPFLVRQGGLSLRSTIGLDVIHGQEG